MPTLVQPEPSFEEAAEIQRFWEDNHERLLAEFPERFVAADPATGDVIASNLDLALLIYELRDRGLDPRTDVAIEFITARAAKLIL